MRVISGKYKRRNIIPPKNLPVRPTTDMAKESLFNILSNRIDFTGLQVLDLFAGTGNMSYEFVSRGVDEVISVDTNYKCISFIKQTAEKLAMTQLKVVKQDVFKFVKSCSKKFDIIFADPPYSLENINEIAELIFENNLLNEGGLLIIEHPRTINFDNHKNLLEHRNYGSVNFSIFISKG